MSNISPNQWLEAAVAAATELAKTSLCMTASRVVAKHDKLPDDMSGSWVALVGNGTSVQVGLALSQDGCHALSRAFLRMSPDEGPLAEDDVIDALGEMANVIAGGVKRRMANLDPTTRLGLPIVVRGRVEVGDRMSAAMAELQVGKTTAHLIILCSRETAAPNGT